MYFDYLRHPPKKYQTKLFELNVIYTKHLKVLETTYDGRFGSNLPAVEANSLCGYFVFDFVNTDLCVQVTQDFSSKNEKYNLLCFDEYGIKEKMDLISKTAVAKYLQELNKQNITKIT